MAKSPLDANDHGHHIQPTGMYLGTAVKLAVFMGLTILAAIYDVGHFAAKIIPFGDDLKVGYYINNLVAVGIAGIKAYIVVMFFMHLKWASSTAKMWALMGFFFLPVLFSVFVDYWTRPHEHVNSWIPGQSETALPRILGSQDQAELDPRYSNEQNRNPKSAL
ncbi:MAG TPA: cytochrome C oxidase subunit IV family protein [Fimbriimonas sp.]|nr:cytochrome C oxidase subunit IV family protein [Fimbriimonas sp.]